MDNLTKYYPSIAAIISNDSQFNFLVGLHPSLSSSMYQIVGNFQILGYHNLSISCFEIYFLEIYNLMYRYHYDDKISENSRKLISYHLNVDVIELDKRLEKMIKTMRNTEKLYLRSKAFNDRLTPIEENRENEETTKERDINK